VRSQRGRRNRAHMLFLVSCALQASHFHSLQIIAPSCMQ